MKNIYDIAVLGAGASGLAFANFCNSKNIAIIDSNSKAGAKLKISGGGRCNITNKNVSKDNYFGNLDFVHDILSNFDNKSLIKFLSQNRLDLSLEDKIVKGQYFCKTSQHIIDMLLGNIDKKSLFLNHTILDVIKKDKHFIIKTSKEEFISKNIVVSTGGLSYPTLGASDIGYKIAQKFGHNIIKTTPSLVGFTVQKDQFWFKKLTGLSLKAKIEVAGKTFIDNILFTHKGCSGPLILNTSLYWSKGSLVCDFLPYINIDNILKNSNKNISTAIPLPKRFIKEFLNSIDLEDKSISKLTVTDKEKLSLLKSYKFSPAGNFGYTKAEVTRGGVDVSDIDSSSMQSKKEDGLFFIGEVLDVTGELGGYNFQFAFSSANSCAKYLNINL
jgi:predicted Rossmann fold flavoprotein